MSYDLRIYFPQDEFPESQWDDVLSLFHAQESASEVLDNPTEYRQWYVTLQSTTTKKPRFDAVEQAVRRMTGQLLWLENAHVRIYVHRVPSYPPNNRPDCVPGDARWVVFLECDFSVKSVWTMFAIPYYALGTIDGITVHDCQWHCDENLYSFRDPADWAEFASLAVVVLVSSSRRKEPQISELVAQGFMSDDGRILL